MWTRSGERGNQWYGATVFLNPQTLSTPQTIATPVQITFEGVLSNGYQGDMALDDITFNDGPCPASVSCDFEDQNICGYSQDTTDQFDWTRQKGHTGTVSTGPSADHTYGTASG